VTTAPSTQPPETEPATSPSSLTAMAAPGSRGPEPSMSTTRAMATRRPADRQRSMSSRISRTGGTLPGDLAGQLLEGSQRVALDEGVDVREGGGHAARQRGVAGRDLQRVHPDDAMGHPGQACHLLAEDGRIAAIPAVGE